MNGEYDRVIEETELMDEVAARLKDEVRVAAVRVRAQAARFLPTADSGTALAPGAEGDESAAG